MPLNEFKKKISECSEFELYLIIDANGYSVWRINHDANRDYSRGYIKEAEYNRLMDVVEESNERVVLAVEQTARFGVETPILEGSKQGSPDYWLWFRWWDAWQKSLTEQEVRDIQKDGDFSKYRPPGNWKT